jgi:HD-GYP domain-containing protein (c-di-GMP phosphodiesterase class II)
MKKTEGTKKSNMPKSKKTELGKVESKIVKSKNSKTVPTKIDSKKTGSMLDTSITDSEMLARLSHLLLEAHEYTAKHSSRVVDFAVALAEKAELEKSLVDKIRVAAEMHDIGKLGIGQDILNKPSKLTHQEFEKVKKHPEIALKLLKELSFIIDVVNMVYYHHERIDGKGYPEKLSGDQIPVGAKIVSIADAFDAMTSKRTYADAMSYKDAIIELKRCAGTQFDETLVNLFIDVVKDK